MGRLSPEVSTWLADPTSKLSKPQVTQLCWSKQQGMRVQITADIQVSICLGPLVNSVLPTKPLFHAAPPLHPEYARGAHPHPCLPSTRATPEKVLKAVSILILLGQQDVSFATVSEVLQRVVERLDRR